MRDADVDVISVEDILANGRNQVCRNIKSIRRNIN